MMRKKIVSLCMALTLCLSLLPVTALAEENAPTTLYVGNQELPVVLDSYWTTDANTGKLTEYTTGGDEWTVKYDPSTATLTLKNATIKGVVNAENIASAGIYAASSSGPVSLNIVLEGENKVSGGYGINVSSGEAASLSITGSGSLTVSATSANGIGIFVQAQSDANLTIDGANVNAVVTETNGRGVELSTGQAGKPNLTIEVKGGSLQASGQPNGIKFFTNADNTQANAKLKVSGNAMVKTSGITTDADGSGVQLPDLTTEAGTGETGGIVFDGTKGTVYGKVKLQEDLEIGEGESLTIGDGASLDTNGNLTVNGGTLNGTPSGDVTYKVTGVSLNKDSLTLDVGSSETLNAAVAPNNATNQKVTWTSNEERVATVDESGKVEAVAPGTANITVTTQDGSHTATCAVTVTQPVTGVTLDPTSLSLFTGDTATLTATVEPENATNKNVTWSSNDTSVATVDANGLVTAVSAGTATITVTTANGGFTATCAVTVRPDVPPANPNYKITVEATQGGTVTADPTAAKAGTTVTLTPVPDRGYQVGTVAVTDRFGEAVAVTEQTGGTYTFTMPSGQVSVNVTFVEMEAEPLPFTDVNEGDWFHDAVRYVYDNGLMDGVGDGQFAPNATTNRAMVVTILYRLAGEPAVAGQSDFTDVAAGQWYTDAVLWAAQKGIVNGISETEFVPAGDLTREQLATILYRYAESAGYDVSAQADLSGFPDAGDIQSYATEALSWAVAEGLLQGFEDDSLQPGGTATRAQIATILMRFCEGVGA